MVTKREIIGLGGGTFLVVGVMSLVVIGFNDGTKNPTPAPAVQAAPAKTVPPLVELGTPPPDGIGDQNTYTARQIAALVSKKLGKPYTLWRACETSGSQRTEYFGTAFPTSGGETRRYSIVLRSNAPMEFSSEVDDSAWSCDDQRTLVESREVITTEKMLAEETERSKRIAESEALEASPSSEPVSLVTGGGEPSQAQMYGYIDRVSTYAVLIGRGAACGVNTKGYAGRVGSWVDRVAPPGSSAQQTLLSQLMQGSYYHAQQQASGQSPDSCDTVARAISNFGWP